MFFLGGGQEPEFVFGEITATVTLLYGFLFELR